MTVSHLMSRGRSRTRNAAGHNGVKTWLRKGKPNGSTKYNLSSQAQEQLHQIKRKWQHDLVYRSQLCAHGFGVCVSVTVICCEAKWPTRSLIRRTWTTNCVIFIEY